MNTILESKASTLESLSYITAVKMQVDDFYDKQEIFGLSFEILELTRRFYNLFTPLEMADNTAPFAINQLLSISQHLERNLIKELK